jgi:hypothetical protein
VQLNETTIRALQETISAFVETPGMSIGDVMARLPFTQYRAQMVATTEITRAYAEGNMLAGQALREEFPDVPVVKIWYTNADDRVCEICGPLHATEVGLDELFAAGYDKPPAHVNCRCWMEVTTSINA